ncbi:PilZ domain-containing protein [Allosphingosinicella indica]|nr:PilZ domain-containing protein [Allosphingosinicella indica]
MRRRLPKITGTMGAEQIPPHDAETGQRRAKRARVLLSAVLRTGLGDTQVRLRDMSSTGALIESGKPMPVGSEVIFIRGATAVPARVAWAGHGKLGIEFAEPIDEAELLVHIGRRPPPPPPPEPVVLPPQRPMPPPPSAEDWKPVRVWDAKTASWRNRGDAG